MKAVLIYGINDIRIQEWETPIPKTGEILIKVKACAICGTDLRIIQNGHKAIKFPAIIGHEVAGVVEKIGDNVVGDFSIGDKVVVVTPVGCGKCKFCNAGYQNMCDWVSKSVHSLGYYCNGGFAEYMLIPSEAVRNGNLIKFVNNLISFEEISLVEPLSCIINGQQFLNIKRGEVVAIFGCGPIGCMHAYMARHSEASNIIMIEKNKKRIDLVKKLGIADVIINSSTHNVADEIMSLTENKGVDVAIAACSCADGQKSSFDITGIRGRISLFGGVPANERLITIDSNNVHYLEKSVFGAFASSHHHYKEALSLIVSKKIPIKKLITHVYPLEEFKKAIEIISSGEALKVVIKPGE